MNDACGYLAACSGRGMTRRSVTQDHSLASILSSYFHVSTVFSYMFMKTTESVAKEGVGRGAASEEGGWGAECSVVGKAVALLTAAGGRGEEAGLCALACADAAASCALTLDAASYECAGCAPTFPMTSSNSALSAGQKASMVAHVSCHTSCCVPGASTPGEEP